MENSMTTSVRTDVLDAYKTAELAVREIAFILPAPDLSGALKKMKGVIKKGTSLPICECVKIDLRPGSISLTATNLEDTVTLSLPAEVKGAGAICVDYRLLLEYVTGLKDNVLFKVSGSGDSLQICRDTGSYSIPTVPVEDFPQCPAVVDSVKLLIPAATLSEGLAKTIPFVGNDDLRPALCGIFVSIEADKLKMAATDAHKVAVFSLLKGENNFIFNSENNSFILSETTAKLVAGMIKKGGG